MSDQQACPASSPEMANCTLAFRNSTESRKMLPLWKGGEGITHHLGGRHLFVLNKMGPHPRLVLRLSDAVLPSAFDAFQQPGHVLAQGTLHAGPYRYSLTD